MIVERFLSSTFVANRDRRRQRRTETVRSDVGHVLTPVLLRLELLRDSAKPRHAGRNQSINPSINQSTE